MEFKDLCTQMCSVELFVIENLEAPQMSCNGGNGQENRAMEGKACGFGVQSDLVRVMEPLLAVGPEQIISPFSAVPANTNIHLPELM